LYNSYLVNHVINPNSNEYKLTAIVMDIPGHRLFTPVGWGTCTGATRRLRFEIVNVEIMQHVFVIEYF
jgi:hypothetical protein